MEGKRITRKRADNIFLDAMGVLKVGWWTRHAIYLAVRLGGRVAWERRGKLL